MIYEVRDRYIGLLGCGARQVRPHAAMYIHTDPPQIIMSGKMVQAFKPTTKPIKSSTWPNLGLPRAKSRGEGKK